MSLLFLLCVTCAALYGSALFINALAEWLFPSPLCQQCRRLPAAHLRHEKRRVREARRRRLRLPGDRIWP